MNRFSVASVVASLVALTGTTGTTEAQTKYAGKYKCADGAVIGQAIRYLTKSPVPSGSDKIQIVTTKTKTWKVGAKEAAFKAEVKDRPVAIVSFPTLYEGDVAGVFSAGATASPMDVLFCELRRPDKKGFDWSKVVASQVSVLTERKFHVAASKQSSRWKRRFMDSEIDGVSDSRIFVVVVQPSTKAKTAVRLEVSVVPAPIAVASRAPTKTTTTPKSTKTKTTQSTKAPATAPTKAPETTTSPAPETTTSPAPETTTSPAPETTTEPTTETKTEPAPTPEPAPATSPATATASDTRSKILAIASDPSWKPYKYGSSYAFAEYGGEQIKLDCSRFVNIVYIRAGVSYSYQPTSSLATGAGGLFVEVKTPQVGDLIVWRQDWGSKSNHVGIVADAAGKTFWHNSNSNIHYTDSSRETYYATPHKYFRLKTL